MQLRTGSKALKCAKLFKPVAKRIIKYHNGSIAIMLHVLKNLSCLT